MLGKSSPTSTSTTPRGPFNTATSSDTSCTLQFAIAFVSVLGCESFEVGFRLALFFAEGAGCRPGFEMSWVRDAVGTCAAGVFPEISWTTGLAAVGATPPLDRRSICSSRPSSCVSLPKTSWWYCSAALRMLASPTATSRASLSLAART